MCLLLREESGKFGELGVEVENVCGFSMKRQMKGNTGAVKRCPKPNAAWNMLVDT